MKVPEWFQKLYWWGNSSSVDTQSNQRVIVTQIINRGNWDQWKWLMKTYGKAELRELIKNIPASEFRRSALRLVSLLLGISQMNYASRNNYIRATKNS